MVQNTPNKSRIIRPEDEERRSDNPAVSTGEANGKPVRPERTRRNPQAKESGVESLPDGEAAAAEQAARARDD